MPEVGKKKFPYTAAGVRKGKREQAKTGKPMTMKKKNVMSGLGKSKKPKMGGKGY